VNPHAGRVRYAGFAKIVELSGGGLLTEPGSAPALADAIGELLADPEKAKRLGDAGHQSVFEHFRIARMAQETIEVFEAARVLRPGVAT
jgi:glycosyltransferase involved in cell wall biosynthesis